MQRRNFIKVMGVGSTVAFMPSILTACGDNGGDSGNNGETGLEAWDGPMPGETDIRRIVLSYAILAPNPHNKQPWIVDLTGPESFDLYVDQTRLLPETDPPFRQIISGRGRFWKTPRWLRETMVTRCPWSTSPKEPTSIQRLRTCLWHRLSW